LSLGRGWLGDLRSILLPAACLCCGSRIAMDPPPLVCPRCRGAFRRPSSPQCPRCGAPQGSITLSREDCLECGDWWPGLEVVRAAVVLDGPARVLVRALKYGGWEDAAREMARLMIPVLREVCRRLSQDPSGEDRFPEPRWALVPIPTTRRRRRRRGYNQAERIAGAISSETKVPVRLLLERRAGGRSQVGLHPHERRANVQSAFGLRSADGRNLQGTSVVLVDDVLTTGATLSAAARVLSGAGADAVYGVVFARALPGD
jgi:ComF family protein